MVLLDTDVTNTPLSPAEADGFTLWLQSRLETHNLLLIVRPTPVAPTQEDNVTIIE